jgi:hypothetical protein
VAMAWLNMTHFLLMDVRGHETYRGGRGSKTQVLTLRETP